MRRLEYKCQDNNAYKNLNLSLVTIIINIAYSLKTSLKIILCEQNLYEITLISNCTIDCNLQKISTY